MDSLVACVWPHTYNQLAKTQQVRRAEVSGGLREQETEEGGRVETAMANMIAPVVLDIYTLTLLAQQHLYKTRKRDVLPCVFILFYRVYRVCIFSFKGLRANLWCNLTPPSVHLSFLPIPTSPVSQVHLHVQHQAHTLLCPSWLAHIPK